MKMKQPIVMMAAITLGFSVQAQSLEEGVKMYQYERYESAKRILDPMAATNVVANYYLGLSELGLAHRDQAYAVFLKYPEDAANMAGLARVAYLKGDVAEGNKLAAVVAGKAGKKAWEPLKYAADAITATEGGNRQQAIDWYKESLKRNENSNTRIALGDAFDKIPGGGGEAMNNYEKVTSKEPNNSLAYSRIGALWYAAKNYKLALENYEKAKNADPTNPLPYRDLANAYFWTGKYDLAKQNIEKYLELSDKTSEDMVQYANILYLSKDYDGAIRVIDELINKGTKTPGLFGILGFSQYEKKDYPNALKNVREYMTRQEKNKITPFDIIQYGKVLLANNMADSANLAFNEAVAKDTAQNKSETYRQVAEGFKAIKEYAKSAEWYDKLVKANPSTQALDYFWRGTMYYYSKNYSEAAKGFEEMETKYPDQPSATYWRGRVAAAQDEEGKTGVAEPFYLSWLSKVGDNYDKKNDLLQAYTYLAIYYYNKGDKDAMKTYMDKIEAVDPANSVLKQLKDLKDSGKKGKTAQ